MNRTAVGVDNTSVNTGRRNSVKVRVQACNPSIYFNDCLCHIAAQKDAKRFSVMSGFDVEEFVVNIFYWFAFDKSTKRKNILKDHCQFCGHSYRSLVSMWWLSLKLAIKRILEQFPGLVSFFKSKNEGQACLR